MKTPFSPRLAPSVNNRYIPPFILSGAEQALIRNVNNSDEDIEGSIGNLRIDE